MGLTIYHKLTKYIFIVSLVLLPIAQVYAGWTGPVEVVMGPWGNNVGQFGFESGDTADIFPNQFGVDKDGNILIADLVNKRVQIFKTDGSVYGAINKPTEINVTMWPRSLVDFSEGNSFLGNLYVFNYAGDIVYKVNIAKTERYGFTGGYIIKNLDNNTYFFYSPTGQIIKTMTTRPLELGVVNEQSLGSGQYKLTIAYDDRTYVFVSDRDYETHTRDKNKNIYAVLPGLVDKFSPCGKQLGRLILPENTTFSGGAVPGQEQYEFTHDEYGSPVIDINGNVYTWKRTPSKYSILKWTWVDDPNAPTGPDAPTNLAVAASTSGLYLTWAASPQDPGCVTGYEIYRATSAGGVGSTVGTVNAGTLKYNDTSAASGTTYYYKIRAVSGTDYSPYTTEVSRKR